MVNILGINLSELSPSEVLKKIADFLKDSHQHLIVTPNPEIILASHEDEELFYILNHADLSLADGIGLKIAASLFGKKVPRVTGADLTIELLKLAAQTKIKVLILNWENGLSQPDDISNALHNKFPNLIFAIKNINRDKFLETNLISEINSFAPAILFCTLGFPYQEKLLYHNLDKLPSVKVALGIGGSFDFITKKIIRAPKFLRVIGLEWFWRLLNIFNYADSGLRLKRIYRATFVFMAKLFKVKLIYPFLYRPNVACFLFKREDNKAKILIVERKDHAGHWQLPQGGTDGEDIITAGKREIREELGTDKLTIRASFKNVYRYRFKDRGAGYPRLFKNFKGQSQGLLIAEFQGTDNDIKINFWDHASWKWVDSENLVTSVHTVRQEGAKKFLEKFNNLKLI